MHDIVAVRHRRPLRVPSQLTSFFDPLAGPDEVPAGGPGDGDGRTGSVYEIRADLSQPADLDRVIEVTLARYGRIDAVVNAIGSHESARDVLGGALRKASDIFALNALVPISVATAVAIRYWRTHDRQNADRNCVVVNLSAAASIDPADRAVGPAVAAAKAALNVLSLQLGDELIPYKVRVMAVAPAAVPDVVSAGRVADAIERCIEGTDTGRLLVMWADGDEMV